MEKYIKYWFLGLCKFLLKYKKFFKLGARKFHFQKYHQFFQSRFFPFLKLGKFCFWKDKKIIRVSVSWNINNFFWVFVFRKKRKAFFWESIHNFFDVSVSWNIRAVFSWENVRNFLILVLKSSIFREYSKFSRDGFFKTNSRSW